MADKVGNPAGTSNGVSVVVTVGAVAGGVAVARGARAGAIDLFGVGAEPFAVGTAVGVGLPVAVGVATTTGCTGAT